MSRYHQFQGGVISLLALSVSLFVLTGSPKPAEASLLPGSGVDLGDRGGLNPGTGGFNGGSGIGGGGGSGIGGGGSGTGGLDDIEGYFNTIQSYVKKIQNLRSEIGGYLDDLLGNFEDMIGGDIDDLLGELNLPDPVKASEEIEESIESKDNDSVPEDPITEVVPVLVQGQLTAAINVDAARIDAATILSQESQQASAEELSQLQEQVTSSLETGEASGQLSEQSSEVTTQSSAVAQSSADTAQQSQSRVSTQDAIKDLNTISANISTQMSQLSSQSAAQSGQLGNISSQLGTISQLESSQLLRMQQLTTGMAVANQNIADMNERFQGQSNAQVIQNNATANRVAEINSAAYGLLR